MATNNGLNINASNPLSSLLGGTGTSSAEPVDEQVQQGQFNFATSTGAADAYSVALTPAVAALTDGLQVIMTANHTNTTAVPTLAVSGLAAVNIVLEQSIALLDGDIVANSTYVLVYNLSANVFQLINPTVSTANASLVQANSYSYALDTGVANAYIATLVPAPPAPLTPGMLVYLDVANSNTGPSTLVLNGSAATAIKTIDNTPLIGGEMVTGGISIIMYSGFSDFLLLNSSLSSPNPQNGASNFVVDAAGGAQYTTIGAAVTAAIATTPTATSPAVVYIWAGTYTENITLPDFVYLKGAEYGSVFVVGNITYTGTVSCNVQDIFVSNSGGPASFSITSSGPANIVNCQLQNTGGACFAASSSSEPVLKNVELIAGGGGQQFNLTGGCVVAWTNPLGEYTDTPSLINGAALIIVGGTSAGTFILVGGLLTISNCALSVGSIDLAFCSIDAGSTVTITNSQIRSDAPTVDVFTGAGNLIVDGVTLSGSQQGIDPLVQILGNLTLGSIKTTTGAGNGNLSIVPVTNTLGNFSTSISNATAVAQNQTVTIPDVGQSTANFVMTESGGGQFINSGYLQVQSGNIYVGNGGGAHSLICYPAGSSAGYLAVNATDNATGNFTTTLTNATAVAQNQTITIPDCGASTANTLLTSTATPQTIAANNYLTFDRGAQTGTGGGGVWNFTLTNQCGTITTGSDTIGAGGTLSFIVTNANVTANSVIFANPGDNSGLTTLFCTTNVAAGQFSVQIYNSSLVPYTQAFQVVYMIASL